ncbi:MAG: hypothetical protein QM660_13240 [Dysgonomonas sp.]
MKKFIYITILHLSVFILATENINAQDCSSDFTINAVSTPSTCQANGTVTVTLSGDTTNIFNVQYGLTSADGFTVNPQEHNVLTNIPPGNYTITVRAFCRIDKDYSIVKTISNITVSGNYKVPIAAFNAATSRKSYDICNTGIIALNVTDGSGNFTFAITSAPAGVTLGSVTPTKSGNVYILPNKNYPSGDYVIQVEDGCYTASCSFTLGQISGFPSFGSSSYTGFRPTGSISTCSSLNFLAGTVNSSNPDYYRYYTDGMYEVAIAPTASSPTTWTAWNMSTLLLDISPYNYSDFYATNSLRIYTRLKGCDNASTYLTTNLKKPTATYTSLPSGCSQASFTIRPWTDYDGMFCYPLSAEVKKNSTNEIVWSKSNWLFNESNTLSLDYDTSYTVTITDQNGTTTTASTNLSLIRRLSLPSDITTCDSYKAQYAAPYGTGCWPIILTVKDASNNVVFTDSTINNMAVRSTTPLNYNETYTFTVTYPNSTPVYSYSFTKSNTSALPTAYNMSLSSGNSCIENYGYLYIYSQGSKSYPIGTTISITGPEGYTPQQMTATTSQSYFYMPSTTLPPGIYTATIDQGCGTPIVTTLNHNGVYSGKNLTYTTERTCSGLKITPSGSMTYQGNPITTYYRLVNGPIGYDKTVVSPGGNFMLSQPGTYVLGILNTNNATGCYISTDTIVYNGLPLALNPIQTNAYVCVESDKGTILLEAMNGVAPYTYQLWNKDNTAKISGIADVVSDSSAYFNYGKADSTYTVRVIDGCGNMFSQPMTLSKLSSARIVYSPNDNKVCTGGTIDLKCITLGNTLYQWTGPNGYSSTTQSPSITDAQSNMTGWYKITVMPEFCGSPVTDSIYITVYPPLAPETVINREICVRTKTTLSNETTGGSGIYTYQWQSSPDGVSNWTNISGATGATYTPPVQIKSGTYYYRKITWDACGTVNSDAIELKFKPCYILVNPNIRSKTKK